MERREQKAVALVYDQERDGAPRVVAGGQGKLAERIVELARSSGVQIVEDPDLVEVLAQVPAGQEIPLVLYQAVAEILAFVYRTNGAYRLREAEGEPVSREPR